MHFSKMQNKCNTVYRFEKERLTSERDQIAIMNDNFRKIRAALTSRHQIPLQWLNRYLSAFTNIKKFQTTWNLSFKNGYFLYLQTLKISASWNLSLTDTCLYLQTLKNVCSKEITHIVCCIGKSQRAELVSSV